MLTDATIKKTIKEKLFSRNASQLILLPVSKLKY